MQTNN
jgi:hypothetical protein